MNRRALALLLLLPAACWSEQVAMSQPPLPEPAVAQTPPATGTAEPSAQTPASETPATDTTTAPATAPVPLAPPDDVDLAGYVPEPTRRRLLPSGCVFAAPARAGAGRIAVLRLLLPFGQRTGRPGVADLALHALADARVGAGGTLRFEESILRLGGRLEFQLGADAAAIELLVPVAGWRDALYQLGEALRAPIVGGDSFAELRAKLVRARAEQRAPPRASTLALALLRWPALGPGEHLARLAAIEPEEVGAFQRVAFGPLGAALAIWIPGETAEVASGLAESALGGWLGGGPPAEPPPPLEPAALPRALQVAEAPVSEVGLALGLPGLEEPQGLETLLLLEVLTMDGLGGRLGQMLREAGAGLVAFDGTVHEEPGRSYLWLATAVPPPALLPFATALVGARDAMRRQPPERAELADAARRLKLRLLATQEDPRAWARRTCEQVLRSPKELRDQPFDLSGLLARLDEPAKLDLGPAASRLAQLPVTMIAVGSPLPEPLPEGTRVHPNAFATGIAGVVPPDAAAQVERARPHLDLALRAAGGRDALAALRGFRGELSLGEGVLSIPERIWARPPDGVRRERRVLATAIMTIATPAGGSERADGETVELSRDEGFQLVEQAARHPLLLLAEIARGQVEYRLVAMRQQGTRQHAVLERDDPARERLRLSIDTESGLVRGLETREWRPGLGRVSVREEFWDYRTTGGLRAPFLQTTLVDERIRIVQEWRSIEPVPPTDDELAGR